MNEINVRLRQEQLRDLQEYVKDIDKNITLILQSLQWDRKHLLQGKQMATCKFDSNHRILADNVKEHEEKCHLTSQNYVPGDLFFPEPLEANAITVVKLSAENINDIINYAAKTDPSFKRSSKPHGPGRAPLTLGRLQATHSADERRALYDAVAAAAPAPLPPPAPQDLADCDLAVDASATAGSAHAELLALRDARRRRARHRGAARDGYQHQLRGLISAQMESFTGKWNDGAADGKTDVTVDESDDGRRGGRESDCRDRERNNSGAKNIYGANRRERTESGGDERREYERDTRKVKKRKYEGDSSKDKRKEYEYDKKYKEKNKLYEYDDRRRQRQYDEKYLEIKQEKDDYISDGRKRKERRYDYKDREQKTDGSSSRDTKRYHKRDERYDKQKSAERHRGRSRDREYDRNYKNYIDCSFLKIKKEPDY